MDADRIRITPRGWVALFGIPLLLVLLILQLRKIDERRREEQFRILHAFLLRPEHAVGLLPLIERFDPADSVVIGRIGEVLHKMIAGGTCLDQADLVVDHGGLYYNVSMYSTYNWRDPIQGRLYLSDPLELAMDSLRNGTQLPSEKIYELAGGTGTLRSAMRLNNATLVVTSWRERHDWE